MLPIRLRLLRHLFWAVFVMAGCATTSHQAPNLSKITPAFLQSKVSRNLRTLSIFEGKARLIIELPGQGYSGNASVYINFPDSIFVKTEAILGIDVGALFVDARYFAAYAPRENILYYGESELLDLRDFLEVDIPTDKLGEALTGLPQIAPDSAATIRYDNGNYLITSLTRTGRRQVWIDPKKYVVTKLIQTNEQGEIVLSQEYSRFGTESGIVMPRTIKITHPIARERLTVYYTSQSVNKHIDRSKFHLKTADNARKVYWGDVENPELDLKKLKKSN